jgi:hypothetical protein
VARRRAPLSEPPGSGNPGYNTTATGASGLPASTLVTSRRDPARRVERRALAPRRRRFERGIAVSNCSGRALAAPYARVAVASVFINLTDCPAGERRGER